MNTKNKYLMGLILIVFTMSSQANSNGITTGQALQKQAEKETIVISTNELVELIENELDLVLIDIRSHNEVSNMGGTIKAEQNNVIPRGWLEFRAPRVAISKDTPIVVYCGAGIRSPLAAKTLQDMGYTNVKNYSDGFIGWRNAGKPVK